MEYGVRSREAHSGSGGVSGPGFPVAGSWLESMALAAYGNPLGYHPNQMPPSAALFLSSLQHSLQSSYENAALELVHKPKKREPPDDDVDKDEDKDKEDEKDKEHSQEMKQGDEEEQEEEKDGHEEDRGDADEVENEASAESWDAQMAALNSWMLNNYTTMMGRLSAFRAAYEAGSNFASDSESESDHSSTSHSRDSSPDNSLHPTYVVVSDKAMMSATSASRSKKRKRLSKPRSANNKESASSESGSTTSQGKKRSLALQRVRYRYEREEYRCSLCSYACTIEKAFLRHLRAHARGTASESQVSCAVCGADRSSEVDLSKHMRRHRDNRFFCCDICIFRTVQLKKLIQHRRMHTGEKPHLCPHCDYRSARRDNLRSHVRRVHKKENLYCDTFSPRGMFIAPKLQPPSPSPVEDATEDVHEEDRGSPASAPAPSSPAPPDEAPPEQESCDVG